MFRIPDTAQLLKHSSRTGVALAACLSAAALVAGCGGGDRVKSFVPQQIIAFGDENSAFDDTATASVATARLVDFGAANVPYAARYTINVVANAQFLCKIGKPDKAARAGCVKPSPSSDPDVLLSTDYPGYPNSTSVFLPQLSEIQYRLDSTIPVIGEVETGDLTGAISGTTPSPVYRSTDHFYYCSVDFDANVGNWVQLLAHDFGGGLSLGGSAGCPQDSGNGRSYASWGAKVDDVEAQVNANLGALRDGVLATVLAGQNDILASWTSVQAGGDQATALRLMSQKGAQLGRVINTIVGTGARVAYLTVPDMGKAPRTAANPALATALTQAFNEGYENAGGLVLSVLTNGHKIVKVDGFTQINNVAASGNYVVSTPACVTDTSLVKLPNGTTIDDAATAGGWTQTMKDKALLLNCTSNNLKIDTPATSTSEAVRAYFGSYLWADDSHLSPVGHSGLAALAITRVRDQL
ncbi:hypothetical protein [Aquabacterium sp. CECT 9606]|uniref:hypothetical protein n=1 Tax=Aquabacterium sp. CECT 9606 TaxID=2845822 RepID=UPI001E432D28|nr:hypothetical protein [Aquabacterium sp. CECT 9606]CAH0347824.1 hypothetical protein AQB9606_00043 [Aquabacterium sp. CECT 9606]